MKAFVDTNVLVYCVDTADAAKQRRAQTLIEELGNRASTVLSTQVLAEYFVTVTRKLKPPLSQNEALESIMALLQYEVVPVDERLVRNTLERLQSSPFSYWDAQIVEAALSAGCDTLYSEDMQHGLRLDNRMTLINPFVPGP